MSGTSFSPRGLEAGWRLMNDLRCLLQQADLRTFALASSLILLTIPRSVIVRRYDAAERLLSGRDCKFSAGSNRSVVLDGAYLGVGIEVLCRRVYSMHPGFEIHERDLVVDLGAGIGEFSVLAAVCGADVISVEAQARLRPILLDCVRKNHCEERVTAITAIVGPHSGVVASDQLRSQRYPHFGSPEVVGMPSLIRQFALNQIDLLKADIEGSEFDLFSGTLDWLKTVRRVVMEVHTEFGSATFLASTLQAHGFRTWLYDNVGRVTAKLDVDGGYLYAESATGSPPRRTF